MPAFDPATVGRAPTAALSISGYRNQARGWDPLSGEGARRLGGRYNPPQSFPVLSLCLSRPCVAAELTRQAEQQWLGVEALLPRDLYRLRLELDAVLDLTDDAALDSLGIDARDLATTDHRLTRAIGSAAYDHGVQAIRSASATGVGQVLAVFCDRVRTDEAEVELLEVWSTIADLADPTMAGRADGGR